MLLPNRSITYDRLVAIACWVVGFALPLGDMFDLAPEDSGLVGIAFVALGHLMTMHGMLGERDRRECAAFNMGQEAARVRSVR